MFGQKQEKLPPIIFDAEFDKGVDKDSFLYEKYDAQIVQKRIELVDAQIEGLRGICQGALLVGFQVTATTTLYGLGVVGWFPAIVAGLPVGVAFGSTLTTITIDDGISISDFGKFCAGIGRCGMLTLSSLKLNFDANNSQAIAQKGIELIQTQVNQYEGIKPAPKQDNFGILAAAIAVTLAFIFLKGKKK